MMKEKSLKNIKTEMFLLYFIYPKDEKMKTAHLALYIISQI